MVEQNYKLETRDINGERYIYSFESRSAFYKFVTNRLSDDEDNEMEILLVTCDIDGTGQQILLSALNNPFVGWEDLAGYLA